VLVFAASSELAAVELVRRFEELPRQDHHESAREPVIVRRGQSAATPGREHHLTLIGRMEDRTRVGLGADVEGAERRDLGSVTSDARQERRAMPGGRQCQELIPKMGIGHGPRVCRPRASATRAQKQVNSLRTRGYAATHRGVGDTFWGKIRSVGIARGRGFRRLLLVVCFLGVATTGPGFAGELEAEVVEYAGQSTGGWACGPVGRARYAGLGARIRYSERAVDDPTGSGLTGIVGAAVEHERVELVDRRYCGLLKECRAYERDPENLVLGGVGATVGDNMRYFGAHFGAQAFGARSRPNSREASVMIVPQLELRVGPEHFAWGTLGFGSPMVTTYRRFGAYVGGGLRLGAHQLEGQLGGFRAGPSMSDDFQTRLNLAWKFPLKGLLGPRIGFSIAEPGGPALPLDWEATVGLALRLGGTSTK